MDYRWLYDELREITGQLVQLDSYIVAFAILTAFIIVLIDAFHLIATRKRKQSGLLGKEYTAGLDGSKLRPMKLYVSEIQGLAGKPDALIVENKHVIPVERKPTARKIRDRYIAQLLVYMRLVEEFEGKKPPYGYLILGKNCRRVKIYNTPERQKWLDSIIEEMRSILSGAPSKPAPQKRKCSRCSVRDHCSFRATQELEQRRESA